MPNNYVDLGNLSAAYLRNPDGTLNTTISDAYFLDLYNRLTAAGKMDDTNEWVVSPPGYWLGAVNNAGYGFRIEHRVGGTPSGYVWFLGFAAPIVSGAANPSRPRYVLTTSGTITTYYNFVVGSVSTSGFISLFMYDAYPTSGATGGTDDFDWNVASNFDPPTTNPSSDPAGFYPNDFLKGQIIGINYTNLVYRNVLVFNEEKPFVGILSNVDTSLTDTYHIYAGSMVAPTYATDTSTSLLYGHGWTSAGAGLGTETIHAYDDTGTAQDDFTLNTSTYLGIQNEYTPDDELITTQAIVTKSSYVKGVMDTDLFRTAGEDGARMGVRNTTDAGVIIKKRNTLSLPFPTAMPTWPEGWPENKQSL